MLLANIEMATKHKYGQEFQSAMQSICTKYAYKYKHDNALLKVIMTELAKADSVRTLKDAPTPGTATANSVADTIEQLKTMTGDVMQKNMTRTTQCWTTTQRMVQKQMIQAPTPKVANPGATGRVAKQRTQTSQTTKTRKRRNTIAPIARRSTHAVHTPAYQKTHVSGTKNAKAGAPELYAIS